MNIIHAPVPNLKSLLLLLLLFYFFKILLYVYLLALIIPILVKNRISTPIDRENQKHFWRLIANIYKIMLMNYTILSQTSVSHSFSNL